MPKVRAVPSDESLFELAVRVGKTLKAVEWKAVTAESCTGGWVAKVLTDVAGSSAWFDRGFVTYSNEAKVSDLGVSQRVLDTRGAVSEETARQMARGALRATGVNVAVAITGIAGPDGGTPDKPVGTVWFGIASRAGRGVAVGAQRKRFNGDREAVRRQSVEMALRMFLGSARKARDAPTLVARKSRDVVTVRARKPRAT
jgi:nicotinamide-nucleotide amidase